jgi:hypothetical protein
MKVSIFSFFLSLLILCSCTGTVVEQQYAVNTPDTVMTLSCPDPTTLKKGSCSPNSLSGLCGYTGEVTIDSTAGTTLKFTGSGTSIGELAELRVVVQDNSLPDKGTVVRCVYGNPTTLEGITLDSPSIKNINCVLPHLPNWTVQDGPTLSCTPPGCSIQCPVAPDDLLEEATTL